MLATGPETRRRRWLRLRLSQKFLIGFVLLSIVLSGGVCLVGYKSIEAKYMDFYYNKALSAAEIAANAISPADVRHYHETLAEDERYLSAFAVMNTVKEHTNMQYLYLYYPADEGYLYIYEARTPADDLADICDIGYIDAYPTTNENMMRVFNTAKPVEALLVTDTALGYVGTVFAPVLDENGKSIALMGADVSMPEVKTELKMFLLQSLGTSVGTVCVIVFLYLIYLRRSVVNQIARLTHSVNAFTQGGNLSYQSTEIRTGDEIETLSDAFSQMAKDVVTYMANLERITADKQRIATELDVATNIQMSVLPRIFPPFPDRDEFDIYASMRPAKEVGGDFYDFYMLDDHRLVFTVSDVSGKGVPAALFMMIAKALMKNQAQEGKPLAEVMMSTSNQLCEGNEASMFVTSLIMLFDFNEHTLTYVNAGHNPPLICRKGGQFEYLKMRRSMPLAAIEGARYREVTIDFAEGDSIFLYTDGVTEALNTSEELYGEPRLLEAFNAMADAQAAPLSDLLGRALDGIDRFAGGAPQADDITMLMVRARR